MKLNKPTFVISTRADNLVKVQKESSHIITIWIRSGKFKNKLPIIRSAIIYEAKSKLDANDYKKRFISFFSIPKTHTKLSVLKGISNVQITQLLSYTKMDKSIRTETYDFDSFRSKKTFLSWKRRGKIIYTLIGRSGKLLGIIWFNKGKHTIRIYSPAREKPVGKKFLEIVRNNFYPGKPKSTVSKNR